MRHLRSTAAFGAILAAAALFAGGAVKAQLTPTFDVVTPSGSNFTWSYNLALGPNGELNASGVDVVPGSSGPDYFTIYDFNGYVAGTAFAPVDWTISVQNVGITPVGVTPPVDNPTVANITFTYTGGEIVGPASFIGGIDAFGADSTVGSPNAGGAFSYQNRKDNPGKPDDDKRNYGAGSLTTPAAVPETSSLMLLVPGLVPLGIMLRRRVHKS